MNLDSSNNRNFLLDKHNIEILFMSKFGHLLKEYDHREIMEFYTPTKVQRNIFNVQ